MKRHIDVELNFFSSVAAGVVISLGCVANIRVGGIAGAFLFGLGLFLVCVGGLHLVTGKMCFLFVRGGDENLMFKLPVWLLGNWIGAAVMGLFISCTGVASGDAIARAKMEIPPFEFFLRAILCEMFIFIAVRGYRHVKDPLGKYICVFLGVAMFILCGGEHCIADAFYLPFCPISICPVRTYVFRVMLVFAGNLLGAVLCAGHVYLIHEEDG